MPVVRGILSRQRDKSLGEGLHRPGDVRGMRCMPEERCLQVRRTIPARARLAEGRPGPLQRSRGVPPPHRDKRPGDMRDEDERRDRAFQGRRDRLRTGAGAPWHIGQLRRPGEGLHGAGRTRGVRAPQPGDWPAGRRDRAAEGREDRGREGSLGDNRVQDHRGQGPGDTGHTQEGS